VHKNDDGENNVDDDGDWSGKSVVGQVQALADEMEAA
jgi:hypothetical protein